MHDSAVLALCAGMGNVLQEIISTRRDPRNLAVCAECGSPNDLKYCSGCRQVCGFIVLGFQGCAVAYTVVLAARVHDAPVLACGVLRGGILANPAKGIQDQKQ